jgi:cardiolipin synthase
MLKACEVAKHSIDVEEFVLLNDAVGHRFIECFKRKAQAGVKLRLLLDGYGSRELIDSDVMKSMQRLGIEVEFYRPPQWHKLWEILPRDHRKILIIDQKRAFIGGVCLYAPVRDWHDMMIEVQDAGLVTELNYMFDQSWKQQHKLAGLSEEENSHPDFEMHNELSIYANTPETEDSYFSEELLERISQSVKSIRLVSPYFTPTDELKRSLAFASDRGVKVDIILSRKLDNAMPYYVASQDAGELLKQGMRIYYFQPSVIHLKTMIIDDEWAAIGSCNLDGLSIHHNREAMLVGSEQRFVSNMIREFNQVKKQSIRFSFEDWQARSLHHKLFGQALSPLRHYL